MRAQPLALTQTSIGKKVLMAVTGAILFLFVIGHLIGNLQVFAGPEALNAYAAFLRSIPAALWAARSVLLAALLVHIWAAVATTLQSWRARGQSRYQHRQRYSASNLYARTMRLSGPVILIYVGYHLLHLTFGSAHPDFVVENVYRNVIIGFRDPLASSVYAVAMLFLGMHLVHGVWSMFQTIGLNNQRWTGRLRAFAVGSTALIVIGNIAIPLAVYAGWIG